MAKISELIQQQDSENSMCQVRDISFSGGTYLVQVYDNNLEEEFWPFIQLGDADSIKDCFCSCETEEDYCQHLYKAFSIICRDNLEPLHLRFKQSLWYVLSHLAAERVSCSLDVIQQAEPGKYIHASVTGKELFSIKAKTSVGEKLLKESIEERVIENEENSIKFSNLSSEELSKWQDGKPSFELEYELSFWADIAKALMFYQEQGEKYDIAFSFSKSQIPNGLKLNFPHIDLYFYLPEAVLPQVIPALATVNSPIPIFNYEDQAIEQMTYDPVKYCISVKSDSIAAQLASKASTNEGIEIGAWSYIRGKGFYFQEQHLLVKEPVIHKDQIGAALDLYSSTIKKFLVDFEVHTDPIDLSYQLSFDEQWNLHINAYLFNPGDLDDSQSVCFGMWVFREGHGFYKVKGLIFETCRTEILTANVSDFVSRHRSWLNLQEKFHTNLSNIETKLTYNLSKKGQLSFDSYADIDDTASDCMDFGDWVFIEGQGFYPKSTIRFGGAIRTGKVIEKEKISPFIREHYEDLECIQGFFSDRCPVEKVGVTIRIVEQNKIKVTPKYEMTRGFRTGLFQAFGRYVHVVGKGFYELPAEMYLPERFCEESIIEGEACIDFLRTDIKVLRAYILEIDEELCRPKSQYWIVEKIRKVDQDNALGIRMRLILHTDRGVINATDIVQARNNKQHFIFSEAGLISLQDEAFRFLEGIKLGESDRADELLSISMLDFMRMNAVQEFVPTKEDTPDGFHCRHLLQNLQDFMTTEKLVTKGLKSSLRPYQELGLNWLWFLYCNHLSGLLCDDMGLGKTHQSMALLAAVTHLAKGKKLKFFVVCPTSVIYHWQEKLERFLPHIRVYTFYGTQRDIKDFNNDYDLFLTSYGILRMEKELISSIPFELAILDEIQITKNHLSQVHRAAKCLKARMRIGLTGTPIENSLRELKALFDVVLPTYMPDEATFKELFVNPIEKEQSAEHKLLLNQFIKPFVLRRKKTEVLHDLPEKTEEIAHCRLFSKQEELYFDVLAQGKKQLINELEDSSKSIPFIHIFALLTKLKQICNHPALYLGKVKDYNDYPSGKWELFIELLSQAQQSEQKVVVFTQFLGMLDIMEAYLKAKNIGYALVKGSTVHRGEELHRFQNDESCTVFLGSLGAVGLGVDLTAASVVIHYDRWWNAAKENQATDRVHRIGQERGVQVFKLVTKDTLEERIHELIAAKGQLMEDVIGTDDQHEIKQFTRDEIIELFNSIEVN